MDILKENKLISEFMKEYDFEHTDGGLPIGDFSNSWDWLMPVVKKCKNTAYTIINTRHFIEHIDHHLGFCDINNTHRSVINFIKFFNKK